MSRSEDIVGFLSIHHPVSLIAGKLPQSDVDDILDSLVKALSIEVVDMLVVADLDVASASDVLEFCQTRPFGHLKLIAINLTGASVKVQRSLLGILEASEHHLKFIIFSEGEVLPGIVSRAQVFRTVREVQLSAEVKTRVLKALAAASLGEKKILQETLKSWTPEDTEVLRLWAYERMSRRYAAFPKEEVESLGLSEKFAGDVIEALAVLRYADSRRAVASLLLAHILN